MTRFRISLFSLFFLLALHAAAQRSAHFIQNYLPKEYGGFNQMWQAAQDRNGVMYFGSTSNIFVYDGQSWEPIFVKNGVAIRQVVLDSASGVIYVGAVGDFGYLERQANGRLKYISLTGQLNEQQKAFFDVWKVYCLHGEIYFQSTERIFIVKDKKVAGTIEAGADKGFALSFVSNGRLYVRQRTVGLMEVKNRQLALVPGSEPFGSIRILGMLSAGKGRTLVLTGDEGFYEMDERPGANGSCFSPAPVIADSFLVHSFVLGCIWVNDSVFAINSRSGIGFYSRDGKLKEVVNRTSGLTDETPSALFLDREKNVWVMHNNGLSRIAYNSPVLFYGDDTGYTGSPETISRVGDKLYLCTSEGLFVREENKPSAQFMRLGDQKIENWSMTAIDGDMLICTTGGLMLLKNGKYEPVTEYYTNGLRPAPAPSHDLIALEKGGFSIVRRVAPAHYSVIAHFDLANEELLRAGHIRSEPGRPDAYEFWAADRLKQALHIRVDLRDSAITFQRYDTTNGLPAIEYYPVYINDSIYLLNSVSCFRYLPSKDNSPGAKCFAEAKDVFARLSAGNTQGLVPPWDSRLILEIPNEMAVIVFGETNGAIRSERINVGNALDGQVLQYALMEPGDHVWLLSNERVLYYDAGHQSGNSLPFSALIRSVALGNDSLIFGGSDSLAITYAAALDYRHNSITFRFAAPFFMFSNIAAFEYRLDGYDSTWSKLTSSASKDYTNLPEGTYTFRVRARNTFGMPSKEASFTFTILPPWYRTGWAYGFYGFGFLASIFLSVQLSARRLRRQKTRLEAIVSERTAEVVEQKLQLEVAFKDIRDSITYAQRIQDAILPLQSDIRRSFPESFVYFVPRDIVSGDFYWFIRRGNRSFIACVDCTGHGVPGAFMSMVGNTLLSEIVLEKNVEDPGRILDLLHVRVRQALRQDAGGETRDGMDIACCAIDHTTGQLHYAGANRPLWMIRNGRFSEIKPDKFPIAGYQVDEEERKFHCHNLQLLPGDCLYLSSDGYADQFGGEKEKKFMVKRFQQLLLSIHTLPMAEQKNRLEKAFLEWKGNLEQVDDVLVIGFRYIPSA